MLVAGHDNFQFHTVSLNDCHETAALVANVFYAITGQAAAEV